MNIALLICSDLNFDYVDLYLIHWPIRIKKDANVSNLKGEDLLHFNVKEVWEAMEECCKLGLAKSIGVSNFSSVKLSKLLEFATIPPAVDQVRHPQKPFDTFTCSFGDIELIRSPIGYCYQHDHIFNWCL